MSFLEGLMTTARNVISDLNAGSLQQQAVENDLPSIDEDEPLEAIHEGLDESMTTLTVEQLDEKIRKLSLKVIVAKEVGISKSLQQNDEIRWLKQELQAQEINLAERNYKALNAPIDGYQEIMRTAYGNNNVSWARMNQEDQIFEEATVPTSSLSQTMQTGLCEMMEIDLLKNLHLLMIAEKQVQIQSSIWNDIVLKLHEKPGTLDVSFMDNKVRILSEISKTEKFKTQLEQAGEEQVRKQVVSMCQLKRDVAKEVKRTTSELEGKVFATGEEDTPARQILRSLSSESFNAPVDVGSDSPEDKADRVPPQRQRSSLKLRLAREKAAARLADSKRRFSAESLAVSADDSADGDSSMDTTVDVTNVKTSNEVHRIRERVLSTLGVKEFPVTAA